MRFLYAMAIGLAATSAAAAGTFKNLVEAERAFAADSPLRGVKPAFLEVLATDSMLYRPGPVNGRDYFAGRPEVAPFTLEWAPAAAEASADIGYTLGPFKLTPKDGSAPGGGHFFSVWQVDAQGRWRLLLDHGIQHDLTAFPTAVKARGSVGPKVASRQSDLEGFDDALNALRARPHAPDALQPYYADDALVLRSGAPPQRRSDLQASPAMRATAARKLLRIGSDGRLAATTGVTATDPPQVYMRAWRFVDGEGWKVVVDLIGD
jgi:hypothetical protein